MTIWEKGSITKKEVLRFTVGRDHEYDQQLLWADLAGTTAHAMMLEKVGLLAPSESKDLIAYLRALYRECIEGRLIIGKEHEDVHSFIEATLSGKLGEAGQRIHAGRSRNDQVLLALRLFMRKEIGEMIRNIDSLFGMLMQKSESHRDHFMPGYTHMQAAMPSSFGLWFSAFAESLTDDLRALHYSYEMVNQNPLGSGAGYGSSFPVDRELTTRLLGFHGMNVNSIYAQMTRGKAEKALAAAMSSVAATLSRLSGDVCLFSGENFQFFRIPEEITTGSSIMPHKQNPDLAEMIRAHCNLIQHLPCELNALTINLPTGYHRDLQLTKERLLPAISSLKQCLAMTALLVSHIQVSTRIGEDDRYRKIFSVEEINRRVIEGTPFREAYRQVAEDIRAGEFSPAPPLKHTHTGSTGNPGFQEIRGKFHDIYSRIPLREAEEAISKLMNPNS